MKAWLVPLYNTERRKIMSSANKICSLSTVCVCLYYDSPEYRLIWGKENLFWYIFMDFSRAIKKPIWNSSIILALSSVSLNYHICPEINKILFPTWKLLSLYLFFCFRELGNFSLYNFNIFLFWVQSFQQYEHLNLVKYSHKKQTHQWMLSF